MDKKLASPHCQILVSYPVKLNLQQQIVCQAGKAVRTVETHRGKTIVTLLARKQSTNNIVDRIQMINPAITITVSDYEPQSLEAASK